MFKLNDDFDIEEDFLQEVFNVEKEAIEKQKTPDVTPTFEKKNGCSVPLNESFPSNSAFNTPLRASTSFARPSTSKDFSSTSIDLFSDSGIPNQKHQTTTKVNKTVRQRKFPGPAGLLPERHQNSSFSSSDDFLSELDGDSNDQKESSFEEAAVYSQDTTREFECGCWAAMVDDLGPSGRRLLEVVNLRSLRNNVKHFKNTKVPFLAVAVQSVDSSSPDPALVLKDPSGEMHGTLHRGVWEEYSDKVSVSSVLVLRSVGVVSPGVSSKRIYLNITANNLLSIYSSPPNDENIQVSKLIPSVRCEAGQMLKDWLSIVSSPSRPCGKPALPAPLFTSIAPPKPSPRPPPRPPPPSRRPPPNIRHFPSSTIKRASPLDGHLVKKPKVEERRPPSLSVTSPKGPLPALDSLFEGIDADSLFGDF